MSDLTIGSAAGAGAQMRSAFPARSMLIVLMIGVLSFAGMLLLGAYAPDFRSGKNGGGHALSNAATGFSGLVQLVDSTGRNPVVVRNERMFTSEDLAILFPEDGAVNLDKALGLRPSKPTLIILPKWNTVQDENHRGWVSAKGLLQPLIPGNVLAPKWPLAVQRFRGGGRLRTVVPAATGVEFHSPRLLQTISGGSITPLITDAQGHVVLAQLGSPRLYVLADPDLLSNHGLADIDQAKAAIALLDYLNSTGSRSILFDVTLNGFGHSPSPLRLAFDPPFLATTFAILATLILVSVQALNRFGPIQPRARALPFGKAALIANAAALIRKAGREAAFGSRYAAILRERAIATAQVPPRLRGGAIDDYLDRISPGHPFSTLAAATRDAHQTDELLAAARALHSWPQETGA